MFEYPNGMIDRDTAVPRRQARQARPSLFCWGGRERQVSRLGYISAYCPRGLSLFFGKAGDVSSCVNDWVRRMGGNLMLTDLESTSERRLRRSVHRVDFCLVDESSIGDVCQVVEQCLFLRRAVPNMPLLLLSSSVKDDDFSTERMAICDATLRTPLSRAAFSYGLHAAKHNNARYLRSLVDAAAWA